MKKTSFILFLGVLLFASCGGGTKNTDGSSADGLSFSDFDKNLASLLKIEGEIVVGRVWTDANGENVLVLSQIKEEHFSDDDGPSSDTRLMVKHFVNEEGNYRLLSEIDERESDCGFENRAAFSVSLLNISDLDKNGVAEIYIVYRMGCTSELSPDQLRLVMFENAKKYSITGTTIADYGDRKEGGKTFVDPSFEKLTEAQRNEAMRIWEKAQVSYESFE